jgi:hypothetical protein
MRLEVESSKRALMTNSLGLLKHRTEVSTEHRIKFGRLVHLAGELILDYSVLLYDLGMLEMLVYLGLPGLHLDTCKRLRISQAGESGMQVTRSQSSNALRISSFDLPSNLLVFIARFIREGVMALAFDVGPGLVEAVLDLPAAGSLADVLTDLKDESADWFFWIALPLLPDFLSF